MKKSEQIIIESWETVNYSNIHIIGISEGKEKEKREAMLKRYR